MKNESMIIIKGEPFNEDKSFAALLYTKHITIEVAKVKGGSVTINISLVGSRGGTNVVTPRLFGDDVLKPMRYGLMMTDGSIDKRGLLSDEHPPALAGHHMVNNLAWEKCYVHRRYGPQ